MRITIVDDEPNSIKVTLNYLNKYDSKVNVLGTFTNPFEAIKSLEVHKPDVLLLDIEMPEMNGFDMLEKLDLTDVNVIFITAYDKYAIRAIKCSAIDYILKPFSYEELKEALDKSKELVRNEEFRIDAINQREEVGKTRFIVIRGLSEYTKVRLEEIVFAEGQRGGYTIFHLENGGVLTASKPLAYYQDVLDSDLFEKVHKSHIINMNKIRTVDLDNLKVTMEEGSTLDVAIRRRPVFIQRIKSQANKGGILGRRKS